MHSCIILFGIVRSGKGMLADLISKEANYKMYSINKYIIPKIKTETIFRRMNPINMFKGTGELLCKADIERLAIESRNEMCNDALAAIKRGEKVVIDTIILTDDSYNHYKKHFPDAQFILIHCSLEETIKRVITMNETKIRDNQRTLEQTINQFQILYKPKKKGSFSIEQEEWDRILTTCKEAPPYTDEVVVGIQKALCPSTVEELMKEKWEGSYDCIFSYHLTLNSHEKEWDSKTVDQIIWKKIKKVKGFF